MTELVGAVFNFLPTSHTRDVFLFVALALGIGAILFACKEFTTATFQHIDHQWVFDMSHTRNKYPDQNVIIRTLTVFKKACEVDCVMWEIRGDSNSAYITTLTYGVVPEGMQEEQPSQPLTPGEYYTEGVFWLYDNGEAINFISFVGEFTYP